MKLNQNEKYLLKYMASGISKHSGKNDLINLVYKFGTKIDFHNTNPVNQIIDEMDFYSRYKSIIGRGYER